ncbi:MAG: hypothetical protein ACXWZ4_08890, partial [Gemmatirosa sp.]
MPAPHRSVPALLATTLLGSVLLAGAGACRGAGPARVADAPADTIAIGVALNPERPGMEAIHQGVDLAVATLNAD